MGKVQFQFLFGHLIFVFGVVFYIACGYIPFVLFFLILCIIDVCRLCVYSHTAGLYQLFSFFHSFFHSSTGVCILQRIISANHRGVALNHIELACPDYSCLQNQRQAYDRMYVYAYVWETWTGIVCQKSKGYCCCWSVGV